MAEREVLEPGLSIDGSALMQRASGFAGNDGLPWAAVARAAGQLRGLGWIDWKYNLWPTEASEPRAELIDETTLQRAINIVVTGEGLSAVASRRGLHATTQVNIVNSTVGQLALKDISNVDISVILEAVERSLDDLNAPHDTKEEARGVIRQMRHASTSIASSAAGNVLAAAVRHSIGLP
jgi:hypothetical protein